MMGNSNHMSQQAHHGNGGHTRNGSISPLKNHNANANGGIGTDTASTVGTTSPPASSPRSANNSTNAAMVNGDTITDEGERTFLAPLPPPLSRVSSMRHARKPSLTGKIPDLARIASIAAASQPPAPITLLSHVERTHASQHAQHKRSRTVGALPMTGPLVADDDMDHTGGRSLRAQEEKSKESQDEYGGHATHNGHHSGGHGNGMNGIIITPSTGAPVAVASRIVPSTTVATPALVIASSNDMNGMPSAPPSTRMRPRSASFSISSSTINGIPTLATLYGNNDASRSLRDQLRAILPKSAWWIVEVARRVRKRSNSWTSTAAYSYGHYELPHAPRPHRVPGGSSNAGSGTNSANRSSPPTPHNITLTLPPSASSIGGPHHGHSQSYGGSGRPSSPSSLAPPIAAPRSPPLNSINNSTNGGNGANPTNRLRRAVRAWTRSLPGPLSPVALSQNAAAVAAAGGGGMNGVDPSLASDPPSLFRAMSRTPGGFQAALSSFGASPRAQVRSPLHNNNNSGGMPTGSPRLAPTTAFAFPPDSSLTISLSPPMQPAASPPVPSSASSSSSTSSTSSSSSSTNAIAPEADRVLDELNAASSRDDARRRRKLAFLINDQQQQVESKDEYELPPSNHDSTTSSSIGNSHDDATGGSRLDGIYGVTLDLAMRLLRLDEQLRGKETDVQLAAELGQMLLDKNQSLEQDVLDAQRLTEETRREAVERNQAYAELEKQVAELAHGPARPDEQYAEAMRDVEFFQRRLKEMMSEHKSRLATADNQLEEVEAEKKLEVEQAHHRELQMRARLAVVQQQLEEARTACNDLQGQCEELKATHQSSLKLRLEQYELRHRESLASMDAAIEEERKLRLDAEATLARERDEFERRKNDEARESLKRAASLHGVGGLHDVEVETVGLRAEMRRKQDEINTWKDEYTKMEDAYRTAQERITALNREVDASRALQVALRLAEEKEARQAEEIKQLKAHEGDDDGQSGTPNGTSVATPASNRWTRAVAAATVAASSSGVNIDQHNASLARLEAELQKTIEQMRSDRQAERDADEKRRAEEALSLHDGCRTESESLKAELKRKSGDLKVIREEWARLQGENKELRDSIRGHLDRISSLQETVAATAAAAGDKRSPSSDELITLRTSLDDEKRARYRAEAVGEEKDRTIKRLEDERKTSEDKLQTLRDDNERAQRQRVEELLHIHDSCQTVLADTIARERAEVTRIQGEFASLREAAADRGTMGARLHDHEVALADARARLKERDDAIAQLNDDMKKAAAIWAEERSRAEKRRGEDLLSAQDAAEAKVRADTNGALQERVTALTAELATANATLTKTQGELDRAKQREERRRATLEAKQIAAAAATATAAATASSQAIAEAQAMVEQLKQEVDEQKVEVVRLTKEVEKMQSTINELTEQNTKLQVASLQSDEKIQDYVTELTVAANKMKRQDDQIATMVLLHRAELDEQMRLRSQVEESLAEEKQGRLGAEGTIQQMFCEEADRTRAEQLREAALRNELDATVEKLRIKTEEHAAVNEQLRTLMAQHRHEQEAHQSLQDTYQALQNEVEDAKRRTPRAEAAARQWQQEVALSAELEARAKADAEKARGEAKDAHDVAQQATEKATNAIAEASRAADEVKRMTDEVALAHNEVKQASEQAQRAIANEETMRQALDDAKQRHISVETQLRSEIASVKDDMERLRDREERLRREHEAKESRARRDAELVKNELTEVVASRDKWMAETDDTLATLRGEVKQYREEVVRAKEREERLRTAAERIESEWSGKLATLRDDSERARDRVDKLRRDSEEKEARVRERADKLRDELEVAMDRNIALTKQLEDHDEQHTQELKIVRDEAVRAKEREKKARGDLMTFTDEAKKQLEKAQSDVTAARVREDGARREAKMKEDTLNEQMVELRNALKAMMDTDEANRTTHQDEMKKVNERQRVRDETLRADREAERSRWNDELTRLKDELATLRDHSERVTKNEEKLRGELEERRAKDRVAAGQRADDDDQHVRGLMQQIADGKDDLERARVRETRLRRDMDEKDSKWRDDTNRLRTELDDLQRVVMDERNDHKRIVDELKGEMTRRDRDKARQTNAAATDEQVTKLKLDMVTLRGEAQVARENEALANETITTLRGQLDDHARTIASHQANIEAAELENGSLRGTIATLERRITGYQSQIDDLQRNGSGKGAVPPSDNTNDTNECPVCGQLRCELASLRALCDEQSQSLRTAKSGSRRASVDQHDTENDAQLRTELATAIAARDRAITRERTLATDLVSLQSQLSSRTDQLDQALADVASLRDQLDRLRRDTDAARDRWRALLDERKRNASSIGQATQAQQIAALLDGDDEDTQVWPSLDSMVSPVNQPNHTTDTPTVDDLTRELAKEREGHAQASLLLSRLVRRMNRSNSNSSGTLPVGISSHSSPSLSGAQSPPVAESPRGIARHPAAFSPHTRGSISGPSSSSNPSLSGVAPSLPRRMSSGRVGLPIARTSAPPSPHLQPMITPTPMSTPATIRESPSSSPVHGQSSAAPPSSVMSPPSAIAHMAGLGGPRNFFASPSHGNHDEGNNSSSNIQTSPSSQLFPSSYARGGRTPLDVSFPGMASAGMRLPGWSNSEPIQAAYRTVAGGSRLGFVMSPAPLLPHQAPANPPSVAAAGVPILSASGHPGSGEHTTNSSPSASPPQTPALAPTPARGVTQLRLPSSLAPFGSPVTAALPSSSASSSSMPPSFIPPQSQQSSPSVTASSSMDNLSQNGSNSNNTNINHTMSLSSISESRGASRRGDFE